MIEVDRFSSKRLARQINVVSARATEPAATPPASTDVHRAEIKNMLRALQRFCGERVEGQQPSREKNQNSVQVFHV